MLEDIRQHSHLCRGQAMSRLLVGVVCLGFAAITLAQSVPVAPRTSPNRLPPISITPPVSEEQAAFLREIKDLVGKAAGASSDELPAARAAVERAVSLQFDQLTIESDRRVQELQAQVQAAVALLEKRKAAKAGLVNAEVQRLLSDRSDLHFQPPVFALLRSTPSGRQAQASRPE